MMHSENQKRNPKFRLPFSAVLLYLVLIAVALSGVTFSRYMTGTTVGDTARVAIMRDITVTETGNFAETDKWVITPGVDMIKNEWEFLSGNGSEAVYYRTVSANSGLTADVLADGGKITVSENITKTQLGSLPKDMQIKISATAVQYNGFSEGSAAEYTEAQRALAAWEAVKNK